MGMILYYSVLGFFIKLFFISIITFKFLLKDYKQERWVVREWLKYLFPSVLIPFFGTVKLILSLDKDDFKTLISKINDLEEDFKKAIKKKFESDKVRIFKFLGAVFKYQHSYSGSYETLERHTEVSNKFNNILTKYEWLSTNHPDKSKIESIKVAVSDLIGVLIERCDQDNLLNDIIKDDIDELLTIQLNLFDKLIEEANFINNQIKDKNEQYLKEFYSPKIKEMAKVLKSMEDDITLMHENK